MDILKKAYPYRNLTEGDIASVTNYMHSRFPRLGWVSEQDKMVMRPSRVKDLYRYYFNKLSMIPDEKQYLVVEQESETAVGVLDEAFVAEYGQPGTKFIVRGTPWMMQSIRGDKIFVRGISDPTGAIPSWIGEEIPVPFQVASEVGELRRITEEEYRKGKSLIEISQKLTERYHADEKTIRHALTETYDQCEEGLPVPSDKLLTIEEWDDFIIINSHLGTLVNRTLARLVGHLLSDESGVSIGIQQDPYRIVLQTMGQIDAEDVQKILQRLAGNDITELAIIASKRTGLFKRRLVHVARRFGAISKWTDFSSITLRQLAKSFEGTVIMDEAVRETQEKDMDVPHTREVLKAIAAKEIAVNTVKASVLNEVKTLVCTNCWKYVEMRRVKEIPQIVKCPECGSKLVAALGIADEDMRKVIMKNGARLSEREKDLVSKAEAAGDILRRHRKPTNDFFEAIMEAEREALKERFW